MRSCLKRINSIRTLNENFLILKRSIFDTHKTINQTVPTIFQGKIIILKKKKSKKISFKK